MDVIPVTGQSKGNFKKHIICLSLFFIAINPNDAKNGAQNDVAYDESRQNNVAIVHEGQQERVQATVENPEQDFGNAALSMYANTHTMPYSMQSFNEGVQQSEDDYLRSLYSFDAYKTIASMPIEYAPPNQGMNTKSMDGHLNNLVTLYLDRITALLQDPENIDIALEELKKIYILDPQNSQAHEQERIIQEIQRRFEAQNTQKESSAQPQQLYPTSSDAVIDHHEEAAVTASAIPVNIGTSHVDSEMQKMSFEQVKEQALREAGKRIAKPSLGNDEQRELQIKAFYDEGKSHFNNKEYFLALMSFKKVLLYDPNHLYAAYARQFIVRAIDKIHERETQALGGKVPLPIVVAAPFTEPKMEESHIIPTTVVKPQEESVKDRKKGILKEKIARVMKSVRLFIEREEYGRAQENLATILSLDPSHEEAKELLERIKQTLNEKQAALQVEENEKRVERRKYIREKVARRYNRFRQINQETLKKNLFRKEHQKITAIERALAEKDYSQAKEELDILYLFAPTSTDGAHLQLRMEEEIKKLQTLIGASPQEKSRDRIGERHVKRQSSGGEISPGVELPIKKVPSNDLFLHSLQSFKPFTVLSGVKHDKPGTSQATIAQPQTDQKNKSSREEVVAQEENGKKNKIIPSFQEKVAKNEQYEVSKRADVYLAQHKQELDTYFTRGKRHFAQGNYSLALVMYYKVKELDKTGIYERELADCIQKTKARLEAKE